MGVEDGPAVAACSGEEDNGAERAAGEEGKPAGYLDYVAAAEESGNPGNGEEEEEGSTEDVKDDDGFVVERRGGECDEIEGGGGEAQGRGNQESSHGRIFLLRAQLSICEIERL